MFCSSNYTIAHYDSYNRPRVSKPKGSPESLLSNRGSGMAELILGIEILNLKKSIFGQKKKK